MSYTTDAPLLSDSRWCWIPDLAPGTPGFYLFRRAFAATAAGARLRLAVSADHRYNLYLDGQLLGRGPCRGDLHHYHYETYDLPVAPGAHVLAAEAVVFPTTLVRGRNVYGEMHAGGGFLVGGGVFEGERRALSLSTADGWRCRRDPSRTLSWPVPPPAGPLFAIAPTEEHRAADALPGFVDAGFRDDGWTAPAALSDAVFHERTANTVSLWWLEARSIPMMEEKPRAPARVARVEGAAPRAAVERFFASGEGPLVLPAGGAADITLDLGHLDTVFPELTVSGGAGAVADLVYAESLWKDGRKGVRSDPEGEVVGYGDRLHAASAPWTFRPFWFRTCRFIRLRLSAPADAGLTLHRFGLSSVSYPFELKAAYDDGDPDTPWIWDTAWRTARLCAHEHYEDCPYYEQLQYVGDTRIQALISYALTGDGRLGRQALRQFDHSRLPEGITQSRYPSSWPQVIPGFSLFWVMMIGDYDRYFGDDRLLRELFPGMLAVLDWFERRARPDGLLDHPNFWNFVDWLPEWARPFPWGRGDGSPARGEDRPDAVHALLYAEACRVAAALCGRLGERRTGAALAARHRRTVRAVRRHCYDRDRRLYADVPGGSHASQHANAWAILADAEPRRGQAALARRLAGPGLSRATLYFTFYLFRAWEKAGAYDLFWPELKQWSALRAWDLTTFPEEPDPTTNRSDCHAWSAAPLYEYVAGVLGLRPGAPGFAEVRVQPHFGPLRHAAGHAPAGDARADIAWERDERGRVKLTVALDRPRPLRVVWPDGAECYAAKHRRRTFEWMPPHGRKPVRKEIPTP